jgi:hypothetical protein
MATTAASKRNIGGNMRSQYVFAAVKEIGNRFMLCRVASISTRRLHIDSTRSSDTINKCLNLIAAGDKTARPDSPDAPALIAETV